VQLETYTEALQAAWKAGVISSTDAGANENLRQLYGITLEEHLVIESGILDEIKKNGR
jgi:hypothetical protein